MNILENAVKYSKKNGWVKVTLRKEKNSVRIIIEDNGIGMYKEDLPNIFKRFYRADRSRTGEGSRAWFIHRQMDSGLTQRDYFSQ